jgi:hypothetical protein
VTQGPWIALALAGLLLVQGCAVSERGSSEGPASTHGAASRTSTDQAVTPPSTDEAVSPPSTDGAVSALEDSIQASFDGDAETVCALQTNEYSAAVLRAMAKQGFVDEDATCEEAMLVLSGMIAGFGGAGYALDEVTVLAESDDGKTVTLRATYTGGPSNLETYEVSYMDGRWLVSGDAKTKGIVKSGVTRPSH